MATRLLGGLAGERPDTKSVGSFSLLWIYVYSLLIACVSQVNLFSLVYLAGFISIIIW